MLLPLAEQLLVVSRMNKQLALRCEIPLVSKFACASLGKCKLPLKVPSRKLALSISVTAKSSFGHFRTNT